MSNRPLSPDEAETAIRRGTSAPGGGRFTLTVVEGSSAGLALSLDGTEPGRALIGTSPACALRVGDRLVSRRHAACDVTGRELRLTDLGSTNGTFVGAVRIADAFLRGGERVRIGDTVIRVDVEASNAALAAGPRGFGRLVGESPEMRRLYPLCARLAASDVPVIIEGETGTGKEVLAEAIHEASARAAGPFVVFDCTAVAPSLVESALFGHEKGAFTGATSQRRGVFEQAHGGTLLIDEIGDLDFVLQPKLLRALERSEIQRVGGDRFLRVDVRVLAATRRDLDKEVQAGRFRDDLFFRLNVARLELPALRDRRGDVRVLARFFWDQLGGKDQPIPYELFQSWEDQPWPGNVRELQNAVARRLALGDLAAEAGGAGADDAQRSRRADVIEDILTKRLPLTRAKEVVIAELERRYVERVLAEHGGDVARAAAASGIARRYFNLLRARHRP